MAEITEREHYYHAEATAISGELTLPVHEVIVQPSSVLPPTGGYVAKPSPSFKLGEAVTYTSAYTQVAGNPDPKSKDGWNTLATAVVEGLNVLEVVTADRVVAQVATCYPGKCYIPSVTLLGTRFENLRIAGHEVKLDLNLNAIGDKPGNDQPYTKSSALLNLAKEQCSSIQKLLNGVEDSIATLLGRYNLLPEGSATGSKGEESVECALVSKAEGSYPGSGSGPVIHIPHFGTIYLAAVNIRHSDYSENKKVFENTLVTLTMLQINMGCIASGNITVCCAKTNGGTIPLTP